MRRKFLVQKGFTLVELLNVIALISILSVAVLATINPIEQANKAKDSTVQNDAAEVMNAYERYYANAQTYPWMGWLGDAASPITVDTPVLLPANAAGFGICYADRTDATGTAANTTTACNSTGTNFGLLIAGDELKPSFVGKSEFQTLATNPENGLWLLKDSGAGGSVFVCYIPKAKSNRQLTGKLYCLTGGDTPAITKAGTGDCAAPATTTGDDWTDVAAAIPTDGSAAELAIFRCVPE